MCSEASSPQGGDPFLELSSILDDARQRRILSILCDRSEPISDRELGFELAARKTGTEPADVSETDLGPVRIDLQHRCLPKLDAVGWIERHPDGIVAAESLPFGDEDSPLPDLQPSDERFWEAVGALLAHPHRQDLVSIIADRRSALTVEELASELGEYDRSSEQGARREDELGVLGRLHHLDLPRLAEAGLIEYDPDERTVVRTRLLTRLGNRIYLATRLLRGLDSDQNDPST